MSTVLEKIDYIVRRNILKYYNKSEKDVEEDIKIIANWIHLQPHLPEHPTKNMIEFFLVNNKFSIEVTKQKLDMYYSIRSLLQDFYKIINPKCTRMTASFETSYIFPLPKLTDNLYRVFFIKFKDVPSEEVDVEGFIGKMVNIQEIRIQEDLMAGQYVVIDCEHLQLQQALKFTPMHGKISTAILEGVYSNRIRAIHVINYHPIATILLKLAKLVLKPKLYERIKMHESMDSFIQYIPLGILPKDYGGNEKSLDELQDLWRNKFIENRELFDKLDILKTNENLRPTPLKDIDGFGIQGTFKKLNID